MKASNLKQRESDRLFFVDVVDSVEKRSWPVGYFWAQDEGKAIDRARSFASGWFRNLQTNTITPRAKAVQGQLETSMSEATDIGQNRTE